MMPSPQLLQQVYWLVYWVASPAQFTLYAAAQVTLLWQTPALTIAAKAMLL
jgi:hypothetical protein